MAVVRAKHHTTNEIAKRDYKTVNKVGHYDAFGHHVGPIWYPPTLGLDLYLLSIDGWWVKEYDSQLSHFIGQSQTGTGQHCTRLYLITKTGPAAVFSAKHGGHEDKRTCSRNRQKHHSLKPTNSSRSPLILKGRWSYFKKLASSNDVARWENHASQENGEINYNCRLQPKSGVR